MSQKPKAIFVGPDQVGNVLIQMKPEWDFLPHVPNPQALMDGLAEGSISAEIPIVLTVDIFFDPSGEDKVFDTTIASISNYCFFGILGYRPQYQTDIVERVNSQGFALSETPRFYFIDRTSPLPSLDKALDRFYKDPAVDQELKLQVRGEDYAPRTQEEDPLLAAHAQASTSPYLGQVVAITSSKGGSGKSTVALSVATYIARASANAAEEGLKNPDGSPARPLKVCLLDLDVRDGQIGFLTGVSSPTVVKLINSDFTEEEVKDVVIHSSRLKIDLLLAPRKPRASDDIPEDFYLTIIQRLRQMYDYVILDTSVNYLDPLLERVAYPMADQIVFVTDIVINSIFSMTRWIKEVTTEKNLGGMGVSKRKIGIVVNKALADVAMDTQKIEQATMGLPILAVIPSHPKMIAAAANRNSMEQVVMHPSLQPSFRRLVKGLVGKKASLSDNLA